MNLAPVSKAIAGAIVTALVALLAKYSIVLDPEVSSAVGVIVYAVVAAVIGYIGVYFAPKNK